MWTLCDYDTFNTGVILPYAVLGIVLFLFFTCSTFICRACFRHRQVSFAKHQDAGQTPNDSIEAEAQKLRTIVPADFGGSEATDPSSQANSGIPGTRGIDGESPNVQIEEDGDHCSTFLDQDVNKKQSLDGLDEPGWQLRSELTTCIFFALCGALLTLN